MLNMLLINQMFHTPPLTKLLYIMEVKKTNTLCTNLPHCKYSCIFCQFCSSAHKIIPFIFLNTSLTVLIFQETLWISLLQSLIYYSLVSNQYLLYINIPFFHFSLFLILNRQYLIRLVFFHYY